jgi:predicted permease
LERLRGLPGAQSAAVTSVMLLEGDQWIDGVNRTDSEWGVLANYRWISPDYFTTLQQRILKGRELNEHDRALKNAVISEATAKAVWPEEDALGRQFSRHGNVFTVVGIAADAHENSLRMPPVNMVYLPYWDDPSNGNFFLVRSTQDTALLADAVRKAIWSYNPEVTIARVHTLDSQVRDSLAPERMETTLLAGFGGAALLLALLGVYGMLSYSVEARTQEIGIRMALGASRQNVYLVTLKEVAVPVVAGLGLGWLASAGIGRSVAALLYGTGTNDVGIALATIAIFLLAAVAAAFVPCRRAAMVDPMQALRME